MDASHPKRKKSKDNPYSLEIENGTPYVCFKDGQNVQQKIELTSELYELFSAFELEDISEINERERHIDKLMNSEYALERFYKAYGTDAETEALHKMRNDLLSEALEVLSATQRRRTVLYYFYGYTLQSIADTEGASKVAVKHSIDTAKEKMKKLLENRVNF